MRRRTMSRLGETEMEVLRHVWALGEASVADVHSTILKDRAIAYTTVMTVMRKLTRKGFLHCDSTGSGICTHQRVRPPRCVRNSCRTFSIRSFRVLHPLSSRHWFAVNESRRVSVRRSRSC